MVGGWTLEELDATEHGFPAVGTPTQAPGQEFEEPVTVLGFRLGDRLRLAESVPAAREEMGPGSVGQKAVVTLILNSHAVVSEGDLLWHNGFGGCLSLFSGVCSATDAGGLVRDTA